MGSAFREWCPALLALGERNGIPMFAKHTVWHVKNVLSDGLSRLVLIQLAALGKPWDRSKVRPGMLSILHLSRFEMLLSSKAALQF